MHQTPEASFPSANLEVEIVLPIPFSGSALKAGLRFVRMLLCDSIKGRCDDHQDAGKDASRNAFQGVHE
jgi:hypothetical protein